MIGMCLMKIYVSSVSSDQLKINNKLLKKRADVLNPQLSATFFPQ